MEFGVMLRDGACLLNDPHVDSSHTCIVIEVIFETSLILNIDFCSSVDRVLLLPNVLNDDDSSGCMDRRRRRFEYI